MKEDFELSQVELKDKLDRILSEVTLFRMRGQLEEAMAKCEQALALDPHSSYAMEMKGDILSEQGKHNTAYETYKEALALTPERTELEEKIALAHLRVVDSQQFMELQEKLYQTPEIKPERGKKAGSAIGLSLFLPGLGHFYLGELTKGMLFFGIAFLLLTYLFSVVVLGGLEHLTEQGPVAGTATTKSEAFDRIFEAAREMSPAKKAAAVGAAVCYLGVYFFAFFDLYKRARLFLLGPTLFTG